VTCSGLAGVPHKAIPFAEKVAGRETMSVFEQEGDVETASFRSQVFPPEVCCV